MAKLLPTRIPLAGDEVTPELFNRLVRVLELNLGQFDPNRTPQFTDSEISELNFVASNSAVSEGQVAKSCIVTTS